MIVRIVRMTFEAQLVPAFIAMFEERKDRIRHFDGCMHLELWQDAHEPNVYLTYSHWQSEQHLDHYRFSEFFKETWTLTKALFADKPQAWSMTQKIIVS